MNALLEFVLQIWAAMPTWTHVAFVGFVMSGVVVLLSHQYGIRRVNTKAARREGWGK